MFGKQKKEKGITLISLVITIIIMLILAGIAISFIIGNNGLFKKAKTAIDIHKKASVQEELQLAVDNGYAEEKTNKLKVAEDMEKDCPGIEWVYKSSLAGHYKGYNFTVIDEKVVMDKLEDNNNFIVNGAIDKLYFWSDDYKDKIKNIIFTIDNDLTKYNNSNIVNGNKPWNVSRKKDNSIIAYLENGEKDSYNLNIVSHKTIELPKNSHRFFSLNALENIYGINNISTSNVTDMSKMFYFCEHISNLDLGNNFDTSNVTNMSGMFYNCPSLTGLNVSNFDTSNVTNMSGMFSSCTNLKSLSLGTNFNTSNVTDMSFMFALCGNLISLDVSSLNTSNVTNMSYMFYGCCNTLISLVLSSLNTSNVTNMSYMFKSCSELTNLNLTNFDTSKVTNMQGMFMYCISLTDLDLGNNFKTSKVTDMRYMFAECNNITNLNLGSNFIISESTKVSDMFKKFATSATDTNQCTIKCTQKVEDTITNNHLIKNTNVVTFDSIS